MEPTCLCCGQEQWARLWVGPDPLQPDHHCLGHRLPTTGNVKRYCSRSWKRLCSFKYTEQDDRFDMQDNQGLAP